MLGGTWERRHAKVERVELRRGIWRSGRGHTDILRFRVRDKRKPINLAGVTYLPGPLSLYAPGSRGSAGRQPGLTHFLREATKHTQRQLAELDAEMALRMAELGEVIARQVRVPFEEIEEQIPDPSSD